LDVRLVLESEELVPVLEQDETVGPLVAKIRYNGTGRLMGRWEVVMPGEDPPAEFDLLTEATLPLELRGSQRRYTEIERFSLFLPPGGEVALPGPDPARIPNQIVGQHRILLRIEAVDDKEGDSDLPAIGAGPGLVHAGAVAGFPMPSLPYIVTTPGSPSAAVPAVFLSSPAEGWVLASGEVPEFRWIGAGTPSLYQLEVRDASTETLVLSAFLRGHTTRYQSPEWLLERLESNALEWRVGWLDERGRRAASAWRALKVAMPQPGDV